MEKKSKKRKSSLGKRKAEVIEVTLRIPKKAKRGPILCRAQCGMPANLRIDGGGKFHLLKCRKKKLELLVGQEERSKTLALGTPIKGSNVHAVGTFDPNSDVVNVNFVQNEFSMVQIMPSDGKYLVQDTKEADSEKDLKHQQATNAFGSSYGKKMLNAFVRREKNQKATLEAEAGADRGSLDQFVKVD